VPLALVVEEVEEEELEPELQGLAGVQLSPQPLIEY